MPPWKIEALDRKLHERSEFDCGNPELDRYLKEVARQAGARGTGRTWVLIDSVETPKNGRRRVLGYYTVSMTSVDLGELPPERRGGLTRQVPAALLGRLAVDRSVQGQRLGEHLLMDALARIRSAAGQVAAHAAVVDAIDEGARAFYLEYGFLDLTSGPLRLFLPIASIP